MPTSSPEFEFIFVWCPEHRRFEWLSQRLDELTAHYLHDNIEKVIRSVFGDKEHES